jgi:hypothetical protein
MTAARGDIGFRAHIPIFWQNYDLVHKLDFSKKGRVVAGTQV